MELDERVIGRKSEIYQVDVEKGQIRKFADAIGDPNPLYRDEAYAAESGYGGIIAPPTFPMAITSEGSDMPLDLDTSRMLHGEQEFIYQRAIRAGDRLECQMTVADLYEKQGKSGLMQFLILDTEMKDADGHLVVTSRMNIIYRPSSSS